MVCYGQTSLQGDAGPLISSVPRNPPPWAFSHYFLNLPLYFFKALSPLSGPSYFLAPQKPRPISNLPDSLAVCLLALPLLGLPHSIPSPVENGWESVSSSVPCSCPSVSFFPSQPNFWDLSNLLSLLISYLDSVWPSPFSIFFLRILSPTKVISCQIQSQRNPLSKLNLLHPLGSISHLHFLLLNVFSSLTFWGWIYIIHLPNWATV